MAFLHYVRSLYFLAPRAEPKLGCVCEQSRLVRTEKEGVANEEKCTFNFRISSFVFSTVSVSESKPSSSLMSRFPRLRVGEWGSMLRVVGRAQLFGTGAGAMPFALSTSTGNEPLPTHKCRRRTKVAILENKGTYLLCIHWAEDLTRYVPRLLLPKALKVCQRTSISKPVTVGRT
jgi:hypothetical protein